MAERPMEKTEPMSAERLAEIAQSFVIGRETIGDLLAHIGVLTRALESCEAKANLAAKICRENYPTIAAGFDIIEDVARTALGKS